MVKKEKKEKKDSLETCLNPHLTPYPFLFCFLSLDITMNPFLNSHKGSTLWIAHSTHSAFSGLTFY